MGFQGLTVVKEDDEYSCLGGRWAGYRLKRDRTN